MNVVVISSSGALDHALQIQFSSRGRPLSSVSAEELIHFPLGEFRDCCLLDVAFYEQLQLGPLADEDFEKQCEIRQQLYRRFADEQGRVILISDGRVLGESDDAGPCREDEERHPSCEVGRQLAQVEVMLEASGCGVILRSGPLLAAEGHGFLSGCVQRLQRGELMRLDGATMTCPTAAADLARVVSGMVDQLLCGADCSGVYHYTSSGQTSAYEFAEVVYAFVSQLVNLPASEGDAMVSEVGAEAWQPQVSPLCCERILFDFGIKQLPWRAFLPRIVKTLCEESSK